jgi:hypothetical protein
MLSISYPSPGVYSYNGGDTVDIPVTITGGQAPYTVVVQFDDEPSPVNWTVDPPRGLTVSLGSIGGVVSIDSPIVSPVATETYTFRAKVTDGNHDTVTVNSLVLNLT